MHMMSEDTPLLEPSFNKNADLQSETLLKQDYRTDVFL